MAIVNVAAAEGPAASAGSGRSSKQKFLRQLYVTLLNDYFHSFLKLMHFLILIWAKIEVIHPSKRIKVFFPWENMNQRYLKQAQLWINLQTNTQAQMWLLVVATRLALPALPHISSMACSSRCNRRSAASSIRRLRSSRESETRVIEGSPPRTYEPLIRPPRVSASKSGSYTASVPFNEWLPWIAARSNSATSRLSCEFNALN